ncbi:hypothetical protein JYT91_00125 [archaeon AH-315-M20]|nr:hypothetical protein [archaeon AH-315-M20]
MDKKSIQKFFIRKLRDFSPPKWGASHTEERNLFKGMPKHLIGRKETKDALEELYKIGFIIKYKKTHETHVSLNNKIPLILDKWFRYYQHMQMEFCVLENHPVHVEF